MSEDLTHLVECGICLDEFTDPRALPCLHAYCLGCLTSLIASETSFNCPECRQKIAVPQGGAENFRKHFLLNRLASVVRAGTLGRAMVGEHDNRTSNRESDGAMIQSQICDHHPEQRISRYCKDCSFTACPECVIDQHQNHDTERISVMAAALENDLVDISIMTARRLEFLQEISADIDFSRAKMEEDLDLASQNISGIAARVSGFKNQEGALQAKLGKTRELAREHVVRAQEKVEEAITNTSSLKSTVDKRRGESAMSTIVEAPIIKQEFLTQQNFPLMSIQWDLSTATAPSLGATSLGDIEQGSDVEWKTEFQVEHRILGPPILTIELVYTGERCISGITRVHKSLVCVTYLSGRSIWVYNQEGQFERELQIPGIEAICDLVALNNNQGKLVIVDGTNKVHFLTLSKELEVQQHTVREIPVEVDRLTINSNKELVVARSDEKTITILTIGGEVKSTIKVPIPDDEVLLLCVRQTKSGFVICDNKNGNVYFTDAKGNILHTSANFVDPRLAVQTFWGHVFIVDQITNRIKILSEMGDVLGNLRGREGNIKDPQHLYVDEVDRLMFVGRRKPGTTGKVLVFDYVPYRLPAIPITLDVTRLTVNVEIPGFSTVTKALYDYEARNADEVGFKTGDTIVIDGDIAAGDWLYGVVQRTKERGLLPGNYVGKLT